MFKIIQPRKHHYERATIGALSDLLKIYHDFSLFPQEEKKATFMVTQDEKRGIYGGALLKSEKVSSTLDFEPNDTDETLLKKMFSAFQPKAKEYWRARVCLCIGEEPNMSIHELKELYENFYQALYREFIKFGEKKNIEYLTFTLKTSVHLHGLVYKNWPYLLRVTVSDPSDKFLHGILSLKGNKFKPRRTRKPSLVSHSSTGANDSSGDSSLSKRRGS